MEENQIQNDGRDGGRLVPVIVVMVPFPAQSHLNQLLHLAYRIASYNIHVHYVGSAIHNRQTKDRVQSWSPFEGDKIQFHDFAIPSFSSPLPDPNDNIKFPSHLLPSFHASLQLRGPVTKLLLELSKTTGRIVIIYDPLMGSVVQDASSIHNTESYIFYGISAFASCSFLQGALGKLLIVEPAIPQGFPSFEGYFSKEMMDFVAYQRKFRKAKGALRNTCRVMEAPFFDVLEKFQGSDSGRQWATGPLNPIKLSQENHSNSYHKCLKWLDKEAPSSVMYVSFGTTTSMADEQIRELAYGLEKSKIKFLWVLRDADKGDIYRGETRRAELPEGFEARTEGQGTVVREWVPQLEILGHTSIGGFMSHCGWGSCMESISMGVPIIAWPMHSDQPHNAALITEYLKVGLLVRKWEHREEIVSSSTISELVRKLIASEEGKEIQKRAKELGRVLQGSAGEGGASHKELESFIAHITR